MKKTMPVATNPNGTFAYVLQSDLDKTSDERPNFVIKVMTLTNWEVLSKISNKMVTGGSAEEVVGAAKSIIKAGLVDWFNMTNEKGQAIPFDIKSLGDVIGIEEIMELAYAVINQKLNSEDKKKLYSPSTSHSESAERKPAGAENDVTANLTQ